jgi:hypothetical protein
MIKALNKNDANEVSDGGTSDAEGDGYECVMCFQDGMKEVDLNDCVLMQMKLRVA